ncbi:TetR family transcriptional regulator [bacterium]|nr:TetR family transcriptional regulator [bacterium]
MKRTREDAEQTRKDLIDAAIRVFGRHGYAATKLSDIADEADVTRGAIYHHFGNKKELYLAIHKEKINPYIQLAEDLLRSDLSPLDKIRTMLKELITKANTDITFAAEQRFTLIRDLDMIEDREVQNYLHSSGEHLFNRLAAVIGEGIETGEIRKEVDPGIAAINLISYMRGLASLLIMEKSMQMFTVNTDELVEQLLKGL